MGTLYGPLSELPKYLTKTMTCPGSRVPILGGGHTWKGCRGRLKTWYDGGQDRTVWECSKCGDRNIARGKADDPRRRVKKARADGGSKPRDFQRQAVYGWEHSIFGPLPTVWLGEIAQLTLEQCQYITDTIWADYGLTDPPKVVGARKGAKSASGTRTKITLPGYSRVAFIVIHETAHSLQEVKEIWPEEYYYKAWHGPAFATLVLDLYARYLGVDFAEAKKKGVDKKPRNVIFAPIDKVPAPVKRVKKLKWRIA